MNKKEDSNYQLDINYLEELSSKLATFPITDIRYLSRMLATNRKTSTVFIAGNGGSAATASHLATDLGVGSLRRRNPIRAISLNENLSVITATANDLNYDEVFSTQISLLAQKNDILIVFSASGNSKNIINAIKAGKNSGLFTVAITGFDGGLAKLEADCSIHFETKIGSYGVVEDLHLITSHILTENIRNYVE
jgi:D-sedoheptulose 7-phosphate isomerase